MSSVVERRAMVPWTIEPGSSSVAVGGVLSIRRPLTGSEVVALPAPSCAIARKS